MKANPRSIYNRIRDAGYTHVHACGILGNIQQESNFETSILGFDGTRSFGLCQWLGTRKRLLGIFASHRGLNVSDWACQVDFIVYELHGTEKTANTRLSNARSTREAALAFSQYYERPNRRYANNAKRMEYAEHFDREFSR